jgi:hypothetical protein
MNMMRVAILTGLMVLIAVPSFAAPRIMSRYGGGSSEYLSRYSGGGNSYYNPRRGGNRMGYTGAHAPIHRNPYPVRRTNAWGAPVAAGGVAALRAPCGNINRVPLRHCAPTKAWDSSFRTVYR